MKVLRLMSWPHLMPTNKPHTARSTPAFKQSPTQELIRDHSVRRSSEGGKAYDDQPMRVLSPGLENNSSTSPINLPAESSRAPYIAFSAAPEFGVQDQKADGSHLSTLPFSATINSTISLVSSASRSPDMRKRGSGTISPLSDGSVNELSQSRSGSPLREDSLGLSDQGPPTEDLRFPLVPFSVLSFREPSYVPRPLSNVANSTPTVLLLETAVRNSSAIQMKGLEATIYDGPAFDIMPKTENDLQRTPVACPPISEDGEDFPISDLTPAEISSLPSSPRLPVVNEMSALTGLDVPPLTDASVPTDTIPQAKAVLIVLGLPKAQDLPSEATAPSLPAIPDMPGMPLNATGLASVPPMPTSNVSKGQKIKAKVFKVVRIGRRVVLRKRVLGIVLGRPLAEPVANRLKVASRGGSGAEGMQVQHLFRPRCRHQHEKAALD